MNTRTHITAPAVSTTTRAEQLVAAHIDAVAEHERYAQRRWHGLAEQEEVNAALKIVEDTLVAVCGARPETAADAELKTAYLQDNLAEATYGNSDLLHAVIGALIDSGRSLEGGAAVDGTERPCRLKVLMSELSVELMRWRGGGHRAVVYPADCRRQSSLQDLLLIPDEEAPPVRMSRCRAADGESSIAVARLKDAISEAVMATGIAGTVLETCFSGAPAATEDGRQYLVPYDAANRLQFAVVQAERLLQVVDDIAEEL